MQSRDTEIRPAARITADENFDVRLSLTRKTGPAMLSAATSPRVIMNRRTETAKTNFPLLVMNRENTMTNALKFFLDSGR
jgi:hypothetical protein